MFFALCSSMIANTFSTRSIIRNYWSRSVFRQMARTTSRSTSFSLWWAARRRIILSRAGARLSVGCGARVWLWARAADWGRLVFPRVWVSVRRDTGGSQGKCCPHREWGFFPRRVKKLRLRSCLFNVNSRSSCVPLGGTFSSKSQKKSQAMGYTCSDDSSRSSSSYLPKICSTVTAYQSITEACCRMVVENKDSPQKSSAAGIFGVFPQMNPPSASAVGSEFLTIWQIPTQMSGNFIYDEWRLRWLIYLFLCVLSVRSFKPWQKDTKKN